MRLKILETGHRPLQKIPLTFIKLMNGGSVPGPILTMSYHRDLFGKYYAACLQDAMRNASCWSLGEVELFAGFVSTLNSCPYCADGHSGVAILGLNGDSELVRAVLTNWRTAPVNEKIRAMLGFLEKLTLTAEDITTQDVEVLRRAGLMDQAIQEAVYVCFLFGVINRLANTFDFGLASEKDPPFLYRRGYGSGSIPG